MHGMLSKNGELTLLANKPNITIFSKLEDWQVANLADAVIERKEAHAGLNLIKVDEIVTDWLRSLTPNEWRKINASRQLSGIKLPVNWIKAWRYIIREQTLRDAERATRNGSRIGSAGHVWNLWAEECVEKYLSNMEKELLALVDAGYLHHEVGIIMAAKYPEEFLKGVRSKAKMDNKADRVNYLLHYTLPMKIARGELTEIALLKLKLFKERA